MRDRARDDLKLTTCPHRQHIQSLQAKDESQHHAGARSAGNLDGEGKQEEGKRAASGSRLRVSSTVGAAKRTVIKRPATYREYGAVDVESHDYLEGESPESHRRRADSGGSGGGGVGGGGGGEGYIAPRAIAVNGAGRGLGDMRKSSVQSLSGIEVTAQSKRSF